MSYAIIAPDERGRVRVESHMVTFALPQEAYALITGETGRTIHRSHGLTIGAEEWRALQRATLTAGKYIVTCEDGAATSLLQWFEGSFEVAKGSHGLFGEPSSVLHSCRLASAAIRAALASKPPAHS